MKGKNIIFDLDGTFFRAETVDIDTFNLALKDIGFQPKSDEEILKLIGFPLDIICLKFLGKKPIWWATRSAIIMFQRVTVAGLSGPHMALAWKKATARTIGSRVRSD